jgi:hypothetical protein
VHISARFAAATPLFANDKAVPPGLTRRGLTLPPGISKKLESGGALPEGIAKRFPPVVTPTPSETAPEMPAPGGAQLSLSLDITVSVSLNITV